MKNDTGWTPSPGDRKSASLTRLKWLGVAMAAASAGYIPGVAAQQESAGVLEEVVVTARRRAELLQDVPIAITALGSEYLEHQQIEEVNDLRTHVPSLGMSNSGAGTNAPIVSLRGQRPAETQLALDPAIPLYFADVAVTPTHGTNLAMYDLENVQVLKGPQGTLFGRNSTGGAILFSPRRPGGEFGGYIKARMGNYGLHHFEGAANLPASDAVRFRLAGRKVDRDGYQDNVADNPLGGDEKYWDEDSMGVRLSMDVDLGALRNQAMLSYDENEIAGRIATPQAWNPDASGLTQLWDLIHNGGLAGSLPAPVRQALGLEGLDEPAIDEAFARQRTRGAHELESDVDGHEEVENWFFANTTEFDISDDLTFKNIFGYRKLEYFETSDSDGTPLPLFGALTSATTPYTLNPGGNTVDAEQWSNEIQLSGYSLDGRLEWMTGAYWYLMEGSEARRSQTIGANSAWPDMPPPDPQLAAPWLIAQSGLLQSRPTGDVENESWALFAEGTYDFNDRWALTLGVRNTWDERSIVANNQANNPGSRELVCVMLADDGTPLSAPDCERELSEDFSHPTWRAALNYTPRDGMLLYGSISTGYRAGGFNLRGNTEATLSPFDEETVTTYEFGNKARWDLGELGSLNTNLAIYRQDYQDIHKTQGIPDPDGGSGFGTATVNAAEAVIQGAEIDVQYAPTGNLFMQVAYAWVDASYDEWLTPDASVPGGLRDNSDANFTYVPEHSITGSLNYTLPLDPALGDITLIANVYWQDEMHTHASADRFANLDWEPDVIARAQEISLEDAYTVWNFTLAWDRFLDSSVDISAWVKNLTDEEYKVGGLNVIDSAGIAAASYGPPRTYGATVQWNF